MSEVDKQHPSQEVLAAFASGSLDEVDAAEIGTHLSECGSCLTLLNDLPEDAFVTNLRESIRPIVPADSTEVATALPSELVDHPRYRVIAVIGAGGMGTVYEAEHRLMQRQVALKVLHSKLLEKPGASERFYREVQAAARLAHPNIVTAHDADQAGGVHFLVMEFVAGVTLARWVAERGPLSIQAACDYARQVALGLQHACEQGMVHRDIKPQNLILTGRSQTTDQPGIVKIVDFGLARFVRESASCEPITAWDSVMGTPDYIAPEQARAARQADIRADLYSLGCTLYFLLAGRPPFPDGSAPEKIAAHLEQAPTPVSELRTDVPGDLAQVIDRLMAKDPARRYQTPAEAAAALEPLADGKSTVRVWPRRSRRRWLVAAAVLLTALGAGGLVYGPALYRVATNQGLIVIESDDPDVEVRITQGGEQVQILDAKSKKKVNLKAGKYQLAVAEGKDGLRLSTREFTLKRGGRQVVSVRFEPASEQVQLKEIRRFEGHIGNVHSLAFSGDGRRALTGSWDRTVRCWDVNTGRELRCFSKRDGIDHAIYCVAISPDGRLGLAGSRAGTVWLWDLDTGAELARFKNPVAENFGVTALAFAPDGRRALAAGYGGTVHVINTAPWKEQRRLEHGTGLWSACFASDGSRIVTAGGHDDRVMLCMWDPETSRELCRSKGTRGGLWSALFSPNGHEILSAHTDGSFYVWDAETLVERRHITGHPEGAISIAFTPDGRRFLSGSYDHTLRLWDVQTGNELFRFVERSLEVRVAISPHGDLALSGAFDGTVRLWQMPSGAK